MVVALAEVLAPKLGFEDQILLRLTIIPPRQKKISYPSMKTI